MEKSGDLVYTIKREWDLKKSSVIEARVEANSREEALEKIKEKLNPGGELDLTFNWYEVVKEEDYSILSLLEEYFPCWFARP